MKTERFTVTMQETGHAEIMSRPIQNTTDEYITLRDQYIELKLEYQKYLRGDHVMMLDSRRDIACARANRFDADLLRVLIQVVKQGIEQQKKYS